MKCYASPVKLLGLLALTAAMVAMAYFCTTLPGFSARIAGWTGVSFFGLGFLIFPMQLLRWAPQVIINDAGISGPRTGVGLIPWADIRGVSFAAVHSVPFLCIETHLPKAYLARLPWYRHLGARHNHLLGFPPLTISFVGLTPSVDEAWWYIMRHRRQFLGVTRVDTRTLPCPELDQAIQ